MPNKYGSRAVGKRARPVLVQLEDTWERGTDNHSETRCHEALSIKAIQSLSGDRIMHARNLLETTFFSIKEIAAIVGYEHASSLVRAFEQEFVVPPRQYRFLFLAGTDSAHKDKEGSNFHAILDGYQFGRHIRKRSSFRGPRSLSTNRQRGA
jgi:hypothetical protein